MTWGVPLLVFYHFAFSYCSWGSQGKNTEVAFNSLLQWTTFCLKNDRMISIRLQGKPSNITVIQVYAPTSNAGEIEVERFYEDLQDLLELTNT